MSNEIRVSEELSKHLSLHPPTKPEEAPSIINMERMREIEIDWLSILDPSCDSDADEAACKAYQHATSQFGVGVSDTAIAIWSYLTDAWERAGYDIPQHYGEFFEKVSASGGGYSGPFHCHKVARYNSETETANSTSIKVLYLLHPSGRLYMPMVGGGANRKPIEADQIKNEFSDFATLGQYLMTSCEYFEQVYEIEHVSSIEESSTEYVSREPFLWTKMYWQIKSRKEFGDKLKEVAKQKIGEADTGEVFDEIFTRGDAGLALLDQRARAYHEFVRYSDSAENELNALRARVRSAGYTLAETKQTGVPAPVPGNPNATADVQEGQIYRTTHKVFKWSTSMVVWRTKTRRGRCGKKRTHRWQEVETKYHSKPYIEWELIDLTKDPIQAKMDVLSKTKSVHFMRQTDNGFISQSGESLVNIMMLCDLSEAERKKTVIVFPDYTPIVGELENYNGATFITAPMPGITPVQFPIASLHEDIGYKLQWTGTELGQLVGSMNLAPGEERQITASSRFSEEVTNTNSYKQSFTSERTSTTDFSEELSKEASREFTKTKSSSGSANVGGSYGPISGGVSAKTSSSQSLKLFSKTMRKAARKASSSVSQKTSVEVSSSFTTKTTVENSSSRTTKVVNVNKGSTLNLMFYQINNRFTGGLYLNDLRIAITSGREVIDGTGIFDTTVFSLSELDEALDAMAPKQLPPIARMHLEGRAINSDGAIDPLNMAPNPDETINRRNSRYWLHLLRELTKALKAEYYRGADSESETLLSINPFNSDDNNVKAVVIDQSVSRLSFPDADVSFDNVFGQGPEDMNPNEHMEQGDLGQAYENLKALLQLMELEEKPLDETQLIVASGGIWMDSAVGEGPALDEYSQAMRDIEQDKAIASLEAMIETNRFNEAKRKAVFDELGSGVTDRILVDGVATLQNSLVLKLSKPVLHEHWKVFLGSEEVTPEAIRNDESESTLRLDFDKKIEFDMSKGIFLISETDDNQVIVY